MGYYTPLLTVVSIYYVVSKYIFDKVNEDGTVIIDELFHVRQGDAYCHHNFTYWDPKITTLPGLYIVSTALIAPFYECSLYNLRFLNLVASCVNLLLFSSILKYVYFGDSYKIVLQALNLTLLPPLYFFSHIYYTDTLSLTFLLAYSRLCLTNNYRFLTVIFGGFSILMRQTNIMWVALVPCHKLLEIFLRSSRVFGNAYISNINLSRTSLIARDIDSSKLKRYYDLHDLIHALLYHFQTCLKTFCSYITLNDLVLIVSHCLLGTGFLVFFLKNGSIVLGDRTAHEASLHVPQLFYFLLFFGVFGLPYVLAKLGSTLKLIYSQKLKVVIIMAVCLAVVHYNTIVHPYLLADNRHYTFYIWNRWFGKYVFAKYVTVPVYVFLLFSLYDNLKDQNCISFLLSYTICSSVVLTLQKMLEVRYFLIPFIVLRLRFVRPSYKIAIFEFIWYMLINIATFYVFFTKEIYWDDFSDRQRIIW